MELCQLIRNNYKNNFTSTRAQTASFKYGEIVLQSPEMGNISRTARPNSEARAATCAAWFGKSSSSSIRIVSRSPRCLFRLSNYTLQYEPLPVPDPTELVEPTSLNKKIRTLYIWKYLISITEFKTFVIFMIYLGDLHPENDMNHGQNPSPMVPQLVQVYLPARLQSLVQALMHSQTWQGPVKW